MTTEQTYQTGDMINGFGTIMRMTENFVFVDSIDNKPIKISKHKFNRIIGQLGIQHIKNPLVDIDWSSEEEVDKYNNSFKFWRTRVRMGDTRKREVHNIQNNKVLYNGEYYLPIDNNDGSKPKYKDGLFWGYCIKKGAEFYDHMSNVKVNVFWVERLIEQETHERLLEYIRTRDNKSIYDRIEGINFKFADLNDLNFVKLNIVEYVKIKKILPLNVNVNNKTVTVGFGSFNRIEFSYRNRSGHLDVNNGYYGPQPMGFDYNIFFRVVPYFCNECRYTDPVSVEDIRTLRNDEILKTLESLCHKLAPVWDEAIENNARLYG